jgi:hypothetical protein
VVYLATLVGRFILITIMVEVGMVRGLGWVALLVISGCGGERTIIHDLRTSQALQAMEIPNGIPKSNVVLSEKKVLVGLLG